MEEVWKPVVGYEGLYEVSNMGNIRNLPKKVKTKNGGYRNIESKNLVGCVIKKYNKVTLTSGKAKRLLFKHIIVAQAFPEICGEWFKNCQVHHKDFNPSNNKAENLIILTPEEHMAIHSFSIVTSVRKSNESGKRKKVISIDPATGKEITFKSHTDAINRGYATSHSGLSISCKKGTLHNGVYWRNV